MASRNTRHLTRVVAAIGVLGVFANAYALDVSTPTPNAVGVATEVKGADELVSQSLKDLVQRMETWNYATVHDLPDSFLQFFDPVLHVQIKEQYADWATKAQGTSEHRLCAPLGVLMGGNDNGIRSIGIVYDSISIVGKEDNEKHISQKEGRIMMLRVVQDQPTAQNPLGIRVVSREVDTEEHWVKVLNRVEVWSQFRAKETKLAADKKLSRDPGR